MLTGLMLGLGIPLGVVCFILIQILRDPNKADQYKALFLTPIFKLGKWGAKSYIASNTSFQVTEFFNRHIIRNVANQSDVKININWVESPDDPILKDGNTIIVCLKKSNDQTRNILNAAEIAIPIVSHPFLRPNVDAHLNNSIDLITLKKLADKLGNHGTFAYKKYFLDPKVKEDQRIGELFQDLLEIDNRGYFVSIFLNELEYINEGVYSKGDTKNRTNEIIDFINYLIDISKIEVGDEVNQWHYVSEVFNVAILLLANNQKMIKQGVKPYLDRINKNLKQGLESIYILAEENSWDFMDRYQENLSGNDRVLIKGRYDIYGIVNNDPRRKSKVRVLLLRKIDVYADDLFKEKIIESGIKAGSIVAGEVSDVSQEVAIITVHGIDGFIRKNQSSWYKINSCEEIFTVGQKREFIVKEINENKMVIELSVLFENDHFWNIEPRPQLGEELNVTVRIKHGLNYYCRTLQGYELVLPFTELSWHDITSEEREAFLGQEIKVRVIGINSDAKLITVSLRNFDADPWPTINKTIKQGSEYVGKVVEVTNHFVKAEIKPGIIGIIPKERLIEAGGALADFKNNIVKGQGLDVYVSRVFVSRQKIHLDLKQNKK